MPDPVLLEVDGPPVPVGVLDHHVGLGAVVGHGEQPDTRLPALAERLGDLRQREPGVEHLRAHEVRRDVPVAETEPGRFDAVRRELVLGVPRLLAPTPAAVGVDAVAEGVHHGVEIGADLEPVDPDVVPGVGHHGDLGVTLGAGHQPQQSLQEPGAADPAGQDRDPPREPGGGGTGCFGRHERSFGGWTRFAVPLDLPERQACNHTSVFLRRRAGGCEEHHPTELVVQRWQVT